MDSQATNTSAEGTQISCHAPETHSDRSGTGCTIAATALHHGGSAD